jgi:hypothetical protein
MVEYLPSFHKVLGSIPSTEKKKMNTLYYIYIYFDKKGKIGIKLNLAHEKTKLHQ